MKPKPTYSVPQANLSLSLPALQFLAIRSVGDIFILPLRSLLRADNLSQFHLSDDGHNDRSDVLKGLLEAHSPPPALASLLTSPALKAGRLDLEISASSIVIQGVFVHKDASLLISISDNDGGWVQDSVRQSERMSFSRFGVPIHVSIEYQREDIDAQISSRISLPSRRCPLYICGAAL